MDTRDVQVFVETAATGSLAAAARRIGLTSMAASRALASLEQELGVRLIHRSTRASGLTPEGEEFLPYARSLLELRESACNAIAPSTHGATGSLKVTSPHIFGRRVIVPLIQKLLSENPSLKVELILSDKILDLVEAGIDVAIRLGYPKDSRLVARKLSQNPRVLCASPKYLEGNGAPKTATDLADHECLRLTHTTHWPFLRGEEHHMIKIGGRFLCSSAEGIREACLEGVGIALLSYWDVADGISSGALKIVSLTDAAPLDLPIWALMPTSRHVPLRVRRFLDCLATSLNAHDPAHEWLGLNEKSSSLGDVETNAHTP